jgi:hypothetical protein
MCPIAERALRRHPAPAQRDRRLTRQIPLLPIHIHQRDRPFHAKRPVRSNRDLHCCCRSRLRWYNLQHFVRHKTPLVFLHWKTLSDKASIANTNMCRGKNPPSAIAIKINRRRRTDLDARRIQHDLIHITPAPILARLYRTHNRVLGRMKMFGRMFVYRRVATAHMAALQAHPQMHPIAVDLQTLLAALRRRLHLPDLVHMCTLHSGHLPSSTILSR